MSKTRLKIALVLFALSALVFSLVVYFQSFYFAIPKNWLSYSNLYYGYSFS
ncbi:hypothetical protein M1116_03945 [Patescibacteria group bacterium]|nr:hypothetical protein [Patescibacteria group bacterium]